MKRMETISAAFELRPKVDMRGAKRRSSAWKTCDCETQASQALHSSSIRTAPPVFPAPEPMPWKTPRPSGLTWGTGDQEHPSCDVSWCGPPPPLLLLSPSLYVHVGADRRRKTSVFLWLPRHLSLRKGGEKRTRSIREGFFCMSLVLGQRWM